MFALQNLTLMSRIRSTFFAEENVRAICKAATARDGKGFSIISAHCEPLKHGFAVMFRDMDEKGGCHAKQYPTDAMTRDAFQLAEMLALIQARLSEGEIACIKDAFNRDSAREEDFSSIALEIWIYLIFFNPSNSVRFNDKAVGWDVEVEHKGVIFTLQCKSIRYGLGRLRKSDARAFEGLLHHLRLRGVDPGANRRFLGFEIPQLDAFKDLGLIKKVAAYVADRCNGASAGGEVFSDVIKLVAEGSSSCETVDAFGKRFSDMTREGAQRPQWSLPVHTFPSADRSVNAGAIQFALPLDVENMIRRCAKQFGQALDGLRGRPNPVVVLGIEASQIKLREGHLVDKAKMRSTIQSVAAEIWGAVTNKSQWADCYGCFLVFKMPSWTLDFLGQGRATSLPLYLEWRNPESGNRRPMLPPLNTRFLLGGGYRA